MFVTAQRGHKASLCHPDNNLPRKSKIKRQKKPPQDGNNETQKSILTVFVLTPAGRQLPVTVNNGPQATIGDLKKAIAKSLHQLSLSLSNLNLTFKGRPLPLDKTLLCQAGVTNMSTITAKVPLLGGSKVDISKTKQIKITFVGSQGCGKTSLIKNYLRQSPLREPGFEYPSTEVQDYDNELKKVKDYHRVLNIVEIGEKLQKSGQQNYDLRGKYYTKCYLFMLCYRSNDLASLQELQIIKKYIEQWFKEKEKSSKKPVFFLLRLQDDIAEKNSNALVQSKKLLKCDAQFSMSTLKSCDNFNVQRQMETALVRYETILTRRKKHRDASNRLFQFLAKDAHGEEFYKHFPFPINDTESQSIQAAVQKLLDENKAVFKGRDKITMWKIQTDELNHIEQHKHKTRLAVNEETFVRDVRVADTITLFYIGDQESIEDEQAQKKDTYQGSVNFLHNKTGLSILKAQKVAKFLTKKKQSHLNDLNDSLFSVEDVTQMLSMMSPQQIRHSNIRKALYKHAKERVQDSLNEYEAEQKKEPAKQMDFSSLFDQKNVMPWNSNSIQIKMRKKNFKFQENDDLDKFAVISIKENPSLQEALIKDMRKEQWFSIFMSKLNDNKLEKLVRILLQNQKTEAGEDGGALAQLTRREQTLDHMDENLDHQFEAGVNSGPQIRSTNADQGSLGDRKGMNLIEPEDDEHKAKDQSSADSLSRVSSSVKRPSSTQPERNLKNVSDDEDYYSDDDEDDDLDTEEQHQVKDQEDKNPEETKDAHHDIFEGLDDKQLIRIWSLITSEQQDEILQRVSSARRSQIEDLTSEHVEQDEHEHLFEKLKKEQYSSAQVVPIFKKQASDWSCIVDPYKDRSDFVLIEVFDRPAKFKDYKSHSIDEEEKHELSASEHEEELPQVRTPQHRLKSQENGREKVSSNKHLSVLEVCSQEKTMYGKGLKRVKSNQNRNGDKIATVSFWNAFQGKTRCKAYFYVPNPVISHKDDEAHRRTIFYEAEQTSEFFFFTEIEKDQVGISLNRNELETEVKQLYVSICKEQRIEQISASEEEKCKMETWCDKYPIRKGDRLYTEVKRQKGVLEKGLFGENNQPDYAPRLFTFKNEDEQEPDIDRIVAYSVPDPIDGPTVCFYLCKVQQTVMRVIGADLCLHLQLTQKTGIEFQVSFLMENQLQVGKIPLPIHMENQWEFDQQDYNELDLTDSESPKRNDIKV